MINDMKKRGGIVFFFFIAIHALDFVTSVPLYPYGSSEGDRILTGDDTKATLTLSKPMPLLTRPRTKVIISINGFVSFTNSVSRSTTIPSAETFIALFMTDLDARSGGKVYYRETQSSSVLSNAKTDIQKLKVNDFIPTRAIVVTYDRVSKYNSNSLLHTFQLVLATDEHRSCAILNYARLDYSGSVTNGFTDTTNHYLRFAPRSSARSLATTSNVGITGKHVYTLWLRVPLYPYGSSVGDQILTGHGNTATLTLSKPMPLLTRPRTRVIVSTDGVISFTRSISRSTTIPHAETFIALFMTDLIASSGGKVYYRETQSSSVLSNAKTDIQRLNVTHDFIPTRAIVVTYHNVPIFGYSHLLHTFQLVLATDEHRSCAILNYHRLDYGGSVTTGFTETTHHYLRFAPRSSARSLAITSNVGISGKHVYKFWWLKGIFRENIKSVVPPGLTSFRLKKNSYLGENGTSIFEVISNQDYPIFGFAKSIQNVPQNVSLFSPSNLSNTASLQFLSVINATQNASFQYGRIATGKFRNHVVCKFQNFTTRMTIIPSVKVTVDIGPGDHEIQRHTHVWLHNITRDGFHVCYKEAYQMSGERNVHINYIAVAIPFIPYGNDINAFREQNYHMMRRNRSSLCETIPLRYKYKTKPVILTSPVDISNSQRKIPIVSWINEIHTENFTVCSKSVEDDITSSFTRDIKVGYSVYGNRTLCSYLQCPSHLECHVNANKQAYCGCISSCDHVKPSDQICGTDYISYESQCHLDRLHCRKRGNSTKTTIQVRHNGKCQHFPYENGVTELAPIAQTSVAFCKYVMLNSYNFNSQLPLMIQLSVSWPQSMTNRTVNNTHDAISVWSEGLTINGFKACVLVAGRHIVNKINQKPLVHWFVYQKGFIYDNGIMQGATFNLSTWYTGSQCVQFGHQIPLYSNTTVLVSIEHRQPRKFNNAMSAWIEESEKKICARELQNFDGKHEGIVLHILVINSTRSLYIGTNKQILLRSRDINNGVNCKSVKYNQELPSLLNPTILLSGTLVSTNSFATTNSPHGMSTWIEATNSTDMKICVKSLKSGRQIPDMKVSYIVLPALCENDWSYVNGKCYKKITTICKSYDQARSVCNSTNATLPVLQSATEEYHLRLTFNHKTWIGLNHRTIADRWEWEGNATSAYKNWLPGQPQNANNGSCATVLTQGNRFGWMSESCQSCEATQCEKSANLLKRSCKLCLNGGVCLSNENDMKRGRKLSCRCLHGYTGDRCEIST